MYDIFGVFRFSLYYKLLQCVQEGSMKNKKNRNKKLPFEFLLPVVILYTSTCICDLFSVEIGVLVESTV